MPGTSLGTAYVQIVPSARGISGAISNVMNGEAAAAGDSAGNTIAGRIKHAIVAAGIGTAVVGGLKKSLSEGAALEQSFHGGLDTLYGDAADKAREYATAAAQAGVSQNSFAEQAVSFGAALKQAYAGDTTKAIEAANTAILDMTDNAAKMGTPIESIQDAYQGFAKQNYTMLDNLKLGYGGTKTEMERLLADAEKLPTAMGKSFDINNLGDVYQAIHLIQDDLKLTGTAAKEAGDTFSGSLGAMKAAYDNFMGNLMLGENVAPAMETLATSMSTFLFGNLIPAIGRIMQSLPVAISTFMRKGLPKFVKSGTDMIKSLTKGAKTALPGMINDFMKSMVDLSGKLQSSLGKFVGLGLKLIKSIADGIIKNIPTFIQSVPVIITNLANAINQNAPKILAVGVSILKHLAVGIIKAIPVLIANIPSIIKAIVAVFQAFSWLNLGKLAIKGIAKGLKAAGGLLKSAVKKPINSIKSLFIASFDTIKTKVTGAFTKIKDSIKNKIDAAKDAVKKAIDKIKNFFPLKIGKIFSGIKLPSFSVKGKAPFGLGGKGTKPSISVSWHAKAEDNPYMFTNATLFGAGERKDEMLYGHANLMNDIREAVGDRQGVVNNWYVTVNGAEDPEEWANKLTRQIKLQLRTV